MRTFTVTEKTIWKIKAKNKDEAMEQCQDNQGKYQHTSWSARL